MFVLLSQQADAVASLARAKPTPGSTVTAPIQLDLWFSQPIQNEFSAVAVMPAEELRLAPAERINLIRGLPVMDSQNRAHLSVEIEPLAPGDYVVEWRVIASDGQSSTGRYAFRVTGS
jgi:methionine-rich copper-binding protein CopC